MKRACHGRDLILPFAISDQISAIATVSLDDLLAALETGGEPPSMHDLMMPYLLTRWGLMSPPIVPSTGFCLGWLIPRLVIIVV